MNQLKLSKSSGLFYITDKDGKEIPGQIGVLIKDKIKDILPKENGTTTSTCLVSVEFLVEVDADTMITE
jgi:hypothetical protein